MPDDWYFKRGGKETGPVDFDELAWCVKKGIITRETQVRKGSGKWKDAALVEGLFDEGGTGKAARAEKIKVTCPACGESGKVAVGRTRVKCTWCGERIDLTTIPPPPPSDDIEEWYYIQNGVQHGPFTFKFLALISSMRGLAPLDFVWQHGMADWVTASSVPGLSFPDPEPVVNNVPKCPTCGSRRIERISLLNKVGVVSLIGVLGISYYGKTFRCLNCNGSW